MMMRGGYVWTGTGSGLLTLLLIAASVVVTVGLIMLARRHIGSSTPAPPSAPIVRQILDERPARAELSEGERQQGCDLLASSTQTSAIQASEPMPSREARVVPRREST
jgi:hypothetical protein